MQRTIINPLNQFIHALKTSFFLRRKLRQPLVSISIIASLGILLSACQTFVDATKYKTYTYKGVQYDVLDATQLKGPYNPENKNVRLLVPKGTDPAKVDEIRPIAICGRSYNEVSNAACERKFGAALERRFAEDEGSDDDGGGSMY